MDLFPCCSSGSLFSWLISQLTCRSFSLKQLSLRVLGSLSFLCLCEHVCPLSSGRYEAVDVTVVI